MKKVIIEQDEQVIRFDDITDNMILGIMWNSGKKSFLIKDNLNRTVGIELQSLTTLDHWTESTHKAYLKEAYSTKEVFVFDSPKELAQWLAE